VLRQSVARQSIADVPLGAFLSGGVDSSLIVALMQDQSATPVNSFTIAFEDAAYNEAPFAKAVADHIGTSHSEMLVTATDAQDVITDLPTIYDEPFADSSQIPTLMVCRAAKRDVTVALSGDAGDELFGGYNRYFWAPRVWRTAGKIPLPLRKLVAGTALALPSGAWNGIGNFANRMRGKSAGVARWDEKAAKLATTAGDARSLEDFYVRLVSQWQTPEEIVRSGGADQLPPLMTDPLPDGVAADPVARMMARDSLTYLPDDILCKVDRAAMAVSLETRVPFLDPDVVELAWRIPTSMKIDGQVGKSILRDILYDHMPQKLIERPKTGFGIPIGQWLRGPLREWAEGLLEEKRLQEEGYFSAPAVRAVWDSHLSGKSDNTAQLWSVLMFQAWHEQTLK
jgi:asparagine synthase (glutamine-hydrolysing)